MKMVSITELSNLGKGAIGLIVTLAALLNVPQVSAVVGQIVKLHPHIAFTVGAVMTLASLLTNPAVTKLIGYSRTATVDTATPTR